MSVIVTVVIKENERGMMITADAEAGEEVTDREAIIATLLRDRVKAFLPFKKLDPED